LFEPGSSTYSYLLGDESTGQAILTDPVITMMERDLAELRRLGPAQALAPPTTAASGKV
jgi:sulfur dioxygenase